MTVPKRWRPFGVPDQAWPDQPDEDGIRHLNVSLRRHRGERGNPETWLRAATALLGLLAIGLFVVSLAAQYRYVMAERHQFVPSAIEAIGLDVAMTVFSLLAIALAWRGLSARTERVLVIVCALGSAGMNFAAANGGSPRSAVAYVMPPLLLAVVVDRVAAVVRRHVLGDTGMSAWSGTGRVALYGVRFILAVPSTAKGLRSQVLAMTPLPGAQEQPVQGKPAVVREVVPRSDSKTAKFLGEVEKHYGPLAQIDPRQVSPISTALAPAADLDTGSARSVLGKRVKAAQNGHGHG